MELFFTSAIEGNRAFLDSAESAHCLKVLRHKEGEVISVIDGSGALFECKIVKYEKNQTLLEVLGVQEQFGAHNYSLEMAVSPTKNIERYEWFLEKATEIGVDSVQPLICAHSERKIVKPERWNKLLLSAAKQSLKGRIPLLKEPLKFSEYIKSVDRSKLNLIAYCGQVEQVEKISVGQAIDKYITDNKAISILIGPEGDFSPEEVEMALGCGFKLVHIGVSRLRTETAAIVACATVYNKLG